MYLLLYLETDAKMYIYTFITCISLQTIGKEYLDSVFFHLILY